MWALAARMLAVRTTYVEARAAISAARRDRRLSRRGLARAKHELDLNWSQLSIVELNARLAALAGDVCEVHRLRAGDAVQLAAALRIGDPELVFVTWDTRLRESAREAGLPVAP